LGEDDVKAIELYIKMRIEELAEVLNYDVRKFVVDYVEEKKKEEIKQKMILEEKKKPKEQFLKFSDPNIERKAFFLLGGKK
jgi:hypothetical protein